MNFECVNVMQCEIVCFVCHTKHIHFHKMLDGIKIKSISTKKQTTLFSTLAISFTSHPRASYSFSLEPKLVKIAAKHLAVWLKAQI